VTEAQDALTDEGRSGLEQQVRIFGLVLDSLSSGVLAADGNDRVIYASRTAQQLLSRSYDELVGHEFGTVVHRDSRDQYAEEQQSVSRGERVHSDLAIVRPDGERVQVVFDRTAVREQGEVVGWVGWTLDAADHRMRRRDVDSRLTSDPVTGLLNRAAVEEQVRFALERAAAQSDVAMAVVIIRLRGYAEARAEMGESAGDRLMSDASLRIRAALRAGDMLGRLDDEFLLVLPELRPGSGYGLEEWSRASGAVVTKKVERALEAAFQVDGVGRRLTARLGVGVFPFDARDVPGLMRSADAGAQSGD
jgi:diguanylate cyclase (GGDEF)-like protein/PAS domain S-box-containing protein